MSVVLLDHRRRSILLVAVAGPCVLLVGLLIPGESGVLPTFECGCEWG